ncbi:type VI secretion system-associated protein TagO [Rhizobium sp. SGZ-381]|uniref:type VI secretion system-associated protein TagO n=1 Tax=Rhizobium sp. SGZ-381 TaxID=3342800 RepID=UPI0036703318
MWMRVGIFCSVAFLFCGFEGALAAPLDECRAIDSALDRLACFDKVSGRTPEVSSAAVPQSDWKVTEEVSKMNDKRVVMVSAESTETIECGYGRKGKINLVIRCMDDATSLYFVTPCHVASGFGGYGRVDIRAGDQKAGTSDMDASTDNSAIGLWSGGEAIPIIKKIAAEQRLRIRFTPFSENPVFAEFHTAGLNEPLSKVKAACSWK